MNFQSKLITIALLAIPFVAKADEIKIIDQTSSMALVEISGDVAETFYNLIKFRKTSVPSTGPVQQKPSETVVGKNITCTKAGREFSCKLIGRGAGEIFSYDEDISTNPAVSRSN